MRAVFLFILVLTFTAEAKSANVDICILGHLTTNRLSGRVVIAHLEGRQEKPLANAVVELRRSGEEEIIEQTTTDANGHFLLSTVAPGNYSLAARPPANETLLFVTAVEVQLLQVKNRKEVVLGLGWIFDGCHGGYAKMRKATNR